MGGDRIKGGRSPKEGACPYPGMGEPGRDRERGEVRKFLKGGFSQTPRSEIANGNMKLG